MSWKKIAVFIYILIFCVISKILFINIYDTTGFVIDELFHIPQGLNYCHLNFFTWDPKITTLPGLYFISTLFMAPIGFCSIYGLRLTNLIAAIINVPLFISLFHLEYDGSKPLSWIAIISGMSMSILPPLYFFSHVYYTDTLSVTTVLIMILLSKNNRHISAALVGIFSVLMRQTNIVWVAIIFGQHALDFFVNYTPVKSSRTKKHKIHTDFWNLYKCCRNFDKTKISYNKFNISNLKPMIPYFIVMVAFVIFVCINGSIVVGDKSAHEAVINIPQLFYFSLFCIVFTLPHMILEVIPFIKYVLKNKLVVLILIATFMTIVHFNTLIHPYLLADNRHYTFYIWIRIYAKYYLAKYVLTVVYLFGIYAALKRIDAIKNFGFVLVYVPCLMLVLVLQKLIDVRYFILPFIVLRLKFKTRNVFILIAEYLWYLLINYLTFNVFFSKEVFWNNFVEPQRIIW